MESEDKNEINLAPWTVTDEADLREASGVSLNEVASFLCRGLIDVAEHAVAFGLKWQHGKLH